MCEGTPRLLRAGRERRSRLYCESVAEKVEEVKVSEESRKEVEETGKEVEESASEDEWLRIDSEPASEAAWLEGVSSLNEEPEEWKESTEGEGDKVVGVRTKEGERVPCVRAREGDYLA